MSKLRTAAFLAFSLVSSTVLAQSPDQAIREELSQFAAAFNKGDVATITGMYTKDAVAMPPGAPAVAGREAIEAFFKGMVGAGLGDMVLKTVEVEFFGDIAVSRDDVSLTAPGPNGGRVQLEGKDLVIWKREGDTWRMYRDIWNLNAQ